MDQIPLEKPPSPAEVFSTPAKAGLFLPIVLTFLITSALFVGGFLGYQYLTRIQLSNPSQSPSPASSPNTTEDWKTYSNTSKSISFQIPSNWNFEPDSNYLVSPQKSLNIQIHGSESMMNECMEKTRTTTRDGFQITYYSHIQGTEACSNQETWNQREIWVTKQDGNSFGPGIIYSYNNEDSTALALFNQILATFKFVEPINQTHSLAEAKKACIQLQGAKAWDDNFQECNPAGTSQDELHTLCQQYGGVFEPDGSTCRHGQIPCGPEPTYYCSFSKLK